MCVASCISVGEFNRWLADIDFELHQRTWVKENQISAITRLHAVRTDCRSVFQGPLCISWICRWTCHCVNRK